MALDLASEISPEAAAVVTGSFLSGAMMGISTLTVPVLLDTASHPAQLVKQWVTVYHYGHRVYPGLAIATCALSGYAAYARHEAGQPWRVFGLAGLMTVSILPFTWTVMQATNNSLFRAHRTQSQSGGREISWQEARKLVARWNWLHVVRSLLPLTGAVICLLGYCEKLVL
ncbi:hypothetical protein FQN54_006392 [Arachnomyces sp. PD_36]|nr:hypothetical protein FQN54_006392 [Arachnomyces sp. PD_36]